MKNWCQWREVERFFERLDGPIGFVFCHVRWVANPKAGFVEIMTSAQARLEMMRDENRS